MVSFYMLFLLLAVVHAGPDGSDACRTAAVYCSNCSLEVFIECMPLLCDAPSFFVPCDSVMPYVDAGATDYSYLWIPAVIMFLLVFVMFYFGCISCKLSFCKCCHCSNV